MPGWHEATKAWQAEKKIQLIGVIQEQHPERCRLFAQWKQMGWPILHDPINLLGMRAVPVVVAIDEHGVVRRTRPSREFVREFLDQSFDPPANRTETAFRRDPDPQHLVELARKVDTAKAWRAVGDERVLWSIEPLKWQAIDAYKRAIEKDPKDAAARFRLGVAYRMRSESDSRVAGDFGRAMTAWGDALDLDPNHYIYRRRIQQYGPRLGKPYPFYDWVETARKEITARGETPIRLLVEPGGAEIASPSRFRIASETAKRPDPKNRIDRDSKFVEIETVVAPAQVKPGAAVRVHLELRPQKAAHWNNEVEPLVVWIDKADGVELSRQHLTTPLPRQPETKETRRVEFEVRVGKDQKEKATLKGFALYYICEDLGGTCLYRRQDFELTVLID